MKKALLVLVLAGSVSPGFAHDPSVRSPNLDPAAAHAVKAGPDRPTGVLNLVLARVRTLNEAKRRPVVVFDLDDTLFQPNYRKKKILIDWARQLPFHAAETAAALEKLDPARMSYRFEEALATVGITDPFMVRSAMRFLKTRFFSDRYLLEDKLVPGAAEYVSALRQAGARIVYLTGRVRGMMEKGTVQALGAAGFPLPDDRNRLHLKEKRTVKDVLFKTIDIQQIRGLGTVVAGFDNEPANCNIIRRFCPGAIVVLVDTLHSENPPPLDAGVCIVKDFRR